MGRRGPPPKSKKDLKLSGSWRAKGRGEFPDDPDEQAKTLKLRPIPDPPAELDDVGKALWIDVVTDLSARGILKPTLDRTMLHRYCSLWSQWLENDVLIRKMGSLVPEYFPERKKKRGAPAEKKKVKRYHKNPLVAMNKDIAVLLKAIEVEFGLSVAARNRIGADGGKKEKKPEDEDLDSYILKRKA